VPTPPSVARAEGRRYATGQINNAYAVLLSSQFQRFCRDLHTEAATFLKQLVPSVIQPTLFSLLTQGRKLDTGNPNPGNIGNDYDRIGLRFWQQPDWNTTANRRRRVDLERLNAWRNAIAHQDFINPVCSGRAVVTLAEVRRWRRSCDGLAGTFDRIIGRYLLGTAGAPPW
jgi:hypothetical protein